MDVHQEMGSFLGVEVLRAPARQMGAVGLDLTEEGNHIAPALHGLIAREHRRCRHGWSIAGVGRTGDQHGSRGGGGESARAWGIKPKRPSLNDELDALYQKRT